MTVHRVESGRGEICNRILRALPAWFGIEKAIVEYTRAVESLATFVAEDAPGRIAGFLSLNLHNEFNAEIHVMAVLPEFHGKGFGTALVEAAENHARLSGARYLTVKTLSPSRANREYEMTRRFYLSVGFVPLEEFKALWGEGNPCLLMIKTI